MISPWSGSRHYAAAVAASAKASRKALGCPMMSAVGAAPR